MALIFTFMMLVYYFVFFRSANRGPGVLLRVLFYLYLALGIAGSVLELSGISPPVYNPNYASAAFLAVCVLIASSGFYRFHAASISQVIPSIRGQGIIESFLIVTQLAAIGFFLPVAATNLSGDVARNRMDSTLLADQLGDGGILNTLASAACPLFTASLLFAFIRLSQPATRDTWWRVGLLFAASLSYIVYILAYVGRDGIIYWAMTVLAIFLVFRSHLSARVRFYVGSVIAGVGMVLMVPFLIITQSRFGENSFTSLLDYFGGQIQNFGDYSSIYRPQTGGLQNFPLFYEWFCNLTSTRCESWATVKSSVFSIYLGQGKEPWLFGTFVSDWVADFGSWGAFAMVCGFFTLCWMLCRTGHGKKMALPRLLLIMFLFLVPFWGVFYFRFGISNSYIVVNLIFVAAVWLVQIFLPAPREGLHRRGYWGDGPPIIHKHELSPVSIAPLSQNRRDITPASDSNQ